ncbi:MAG: NAD(P)/FAD-dependent oxidoreductase [Clostridiales bacterium]|nr:NAD(P)/FAD-dependent oxidoreductase [Clostridiales bacterium]
MSKVIVIGGGAAGMLAAIAAGNCGHEVTIYERNEKLGKKVFITGKGRCNITNAADMDELIRSVIKNNKFLYSAFYTFTNENIVELLEEQGISTKVERGNRVFPVSDHSYDVIGGLTKKLNELGVEICLNSRVKSILIRDGICKGITLFDGTKIDADRVVVCTGGFSYQTTGSDGDGYEFAKKTGHVVTQILPSLVPLNIKEYYIKELQGLSLKNIKVTFFEEKKEIYSDFGEMLFTHFGVSGPVILSASGYITEKLAEKSHISLKIDLKPALSFKELDDRITRDFKENINKDYRNSLGDLLPKKMIPIVIKLSKISPYKKVNEITREERQGLTTLLKEFPATVESTRGFKEAIITRGGISIKDVNPQTMESKKVQGLFFAGEVLDVDALTGGFNLQIAWSTGYLAGLSV